MSNQTLFLIMGISGGLFVFTIVAYLIMRKILNKTDLKRIKQLKEGTKERKYTSDVIYQKIYIYLIRIPYIKRYVNKIRRKIEILNIDDEYLTRRQTAQIITKALLIIIPLTIAIIALTHSDKLLLSILLLFEVFLIETLMGGMVDKLDTKLLKQQIEFFAEIRHAYHEYNMVEEAIYEVSQKDQLEVSRQGEKIYEILISDDPETELEKYYDISPNSFLKEFAGISYLTREFGDRFDKDGASLYLKNLNNITEEMQLEILKREKLDYVFQSLSVIAIVPVLAMQPLRNWAVSNFSFTSKFYDGKLGFIAQILLIILTFICYILTRKIKDNGSIKGAYQDPNKVWQMKLYNKPVVKKIVDMFIPKKRTKEYRKDINLLKDAASKQKIETLYVNRIVYAILVFIASLFLFTQVHNVAVDYIYENPTTQYDLLGGLTESQEKEAMELTKQDNYFLDKLKNKKLTLEQIKFELKSSEYYKDATEEELTQGVQRIQDKLKVVNKEYLKWFEWLLASLFAVVGYWGPKLMLMFQKIMRKLEIENEVMQFQTIILMLMKIERVNVEMILEWLERYSNIFREPISKCVNNYEAGGWEALEELKEEINFEQMIRIVEGLQSAVEKIPIRDAFDELDNEREYYQAKRKESNERLIKRKGMIGKVIGFAPLVTLFVGYLIVPLIAIGLLSMTSSMSSMTAAAM
ncbi:MAG: hypothetical protein J5507_02300 [Clostridia bacterium]|nr:hypothetical protein [Clostridia bacterium]